MPFAIPGIAAALAAILALIILWGTGTFAKAVAGLIPKSVPIIGKLHDLILAIGAVAMAALQWVMADIIGPAFAFIIKPVLAIVQLIESIEQLGRTAAQSWLWLLNSALPAIIHKLETYALRLVKAARAYALALYRKAESYAAALVKAARAYALSLYHTAIKYAAHLYALARTYAHDLVKIETAARVLAIEAARTYAHTLVVAVESDIALTRKALENEIKAITSVSLPDIEHAIAVGVQQAEDYANTAATAAVGVLTTDVTSTVAVTVDGIIDDVGKLAGVIGTDLPDIGALVDDIPLALPVTIAGVSALSLTLSRVAIKYMERCGVPNCRNLSKIGRDLQDLFGAIEGAGFLALVSYMVADPNGAAGEAVDVLGGTVNELGDAARHLIGV